MAEMTAAEARARLKPFEDRLRSLLQILDIAAQAEAAQGRAANLTQDAERRIAQAALRADKADAVADQRVREAEGRLQGAEQALQRRLEETKATLEGQVAQLTSEVAAQRQRLEQAGQALGQAERARDDTLAGIAKEVAAARQSALEQHEAFEIDLRDLEDRIAAKRAEYRSIVEKIQAIRV